WQWGVAERLQRPQPAAAVEAPLGMIERAQRISRGQAFEGGAAEPAPVPQIARVPVAGAARPHQTLGIGFGEALDLAQPQAQCAAMVSLSAPGGGEGRGEVGDSRALADTHLTLPALRAGSLPLRPEGRR